MVGQWRRSGAAACQCRRSATGSAANLAGSASGLASARGRAFHAGEQSTTGTGTDTGTGTGTGDAVDVRWVAAPSAQDQPGPGHTGHAGGAGATARQSRPTSRFRHPGRSSVPGGSQKHALQLPIRCGARPDTGRPGVSP
jgi:hypothetical protein